MTFVHSFNHALIHFTSFQASTEFWNGRQQWLPTWKLDADNGNSDVLQVDYIKVWAI
jgi:hypothetical protein